MMGVNEKILPIKKKTLSFNNFFKRKIKAKYFCDSHITEQIVSGKRSALKEYIKVCWRKGKCCRNSMEIR